MMTQQDLDTITHLSRKYQVKRVVLFGSSVDAQRPGRDIDLAIEGVAPEVYYRYCGELMMSLSRPVDIVDLSAPGRFTDIIRKEGVVLYE